MVGAAVTNLQLPRRMPSTKFTPITLGNLLDATAERKSRGAPNLFCVPRLARRHGNQMETFGYFRLGGGNRFAKFNRVAAPVGRTLELPFFRFAVFVSGGVLRSPASPLCGSSPYLLAPLRSQATALRPCQR